MKTNGRGRRQRGLYQGLTNVFVPCALMLYHLLTEYCQSIWLGRWPGRSSGRLDERYLGMVRSFQLWENACTHAMQKEIRFSLPGVYFIKELRLYRAARPIITAPVPAGILIDAHSGVLFSPCHRKSFHQAPR